MPQRYLWVVVPGFLGFAPNMRRIASALPALMADALATVGDGGGGGCDAVEITATVSRANASPLVQLGGVAAQARRLADEVVEALARLPPDTQLCLLGFSVGGLIAIEAVELLADPDGRRGRGRTYAGGHRGGAFVTVATPHAGAGPSANALGRALSGAVPTLGDVYSPRRPPAWRMGRPAGFRALVAVAEVADPISPPRVALPPLPCGCRDDEAPLAIVEGETGCAEVYRAGDWLAAEVVLRRSPFAPLSSHYSINANPVALCAMALAVAMAFGMAGPGVDGRGSDAEGERRAEECDADLEDAHFVTQLK
jgi:hypothetical protein